MHTGSCNCRGVAFEIDGDLAPPSVCHCGQCRKQSGHCWSSTGIDKTQLRFTSEGTLRWYNASETARRGFCGTCGAFLFWAHNGEDQISVAMGAIDAPTGVRLARHIFVADKGDYYDISDGLPERAQ
ncbi:GFA family protein [Sedimentitalea todarodis]|uniref:GFA family protein n=1 Tax=Sedimentitalea todarodis TaxID=1631240 RepID=A0ABU3VA06_9RHOB|nr:GFA family protein [Sedimentitalea todarodis]MDU9003007.1 GFA family protein [Sedimentitalea todarodis]